MAMEGRIKVVMVLLGLALSGIAKADDELPRHRVKVNVDARVNTVNEEFLSFTLDSWAFAQSKKFTFLDQDVNDPRLNTLLSALAPAYFRVGGTGSSAVEFDLPPVVMSLPDIAPVMETMTTAQWDFLVQLTQNTGLKLLFDLNAQLLYGREWLPTNAIKLLEYCVAQGYGANLNFEIGNEPVAYAKNGGQDMTPAIIAQSFNDLRTILDGYPQLANSLLVGPDKVSVKSKVAQANLTQIVELGGKSLDAVTFHHYYVPQAPDWQALVNLEEFQEYPDIVDIVQGVVASTNHSSLPIWLGEGGDTFNSETVAAGRYASGFLYLDKLGVSARKGINVVMRQSFYGRSAGMLDLDYFPQPDYWLAYVFKQLVGRPVLDLEFAQGGDYVRAYAHCTKPKDDLYKEGDVTIFAMNLNRTTDIELAFATDLRDKIMHVYHLTPDGDDPEPMLAQHVAVNGMRLALTNDTVLPQLSYLSKQVNARYTLPSLQFAFFVILDVGAPACM